MAESRSPNAQRRASMKVVLLCGGQGTRLREETEYKPKPMVEVGGRPILWHIMKHYASYGFKEFILCLGYKSDVIKDYFFNYELRNSDATICLGRDKRVEFHASHPEDGWRVTLADTGLNAMTGARLARVAKYIGDVPFMLTYGDGVSNVDLASLVSLHRRAGRIATVTGVYPPSRFGELVHDGNIVREFREKPRISGGRINGGFFVFEPEIFERLSAKGECVLETEPLESLAGDGELAVYEHDGFWHCMDTYRDFLLLNKLWDSGKAPWRNWDLASAPTE